MSESHFISAEDLACRENPDLYFGEKPEDLKRATSMCRGCPVRKPCLDGALERKEPWGVWGGEVFSRGAVVPRRRLINGLARRATRWLGEQTRSSVRDHVLETTARRLTLLAVVIGGHSRAWRAEEFLADLIRSGTAGTGPRPWRQLRHASGFVYGAVIMRAHDLCRPLARLLDWALAKPRTEALSVTAAIITASYFMNTMGLTGLLGNLENVVAAAILVYGPGRWLRAHRSVQPAAKRNHDKDPN